MSASVYQRVLGDRFALLSPTLQRYFGPIPAGAVGHGTGTYDVAGSRHRILVPALVLLAWRHVLFPELARNVPFTVENIPVAGGVRAIRSFRFARTVRRMDDVVSVRDGVLVDRLGRRGGLEVAFDAEVRDGGVRLESRGLAVHVGQVRMPLPRAACVRIDERADPQAPDRQRVDVRVRVPLLGEVFRYSGAFVYRIEHASTAAARPAPGVCRGPSLD